MRKLLLFTKMERVNIYKSEMSKMVYCKLCAYLFCYFLVLLVSILILFNFRNFG